MNSKITQLINSDDFASLKILVKSINYEKNQFDIIEIFEDVISETAWSKIFAYLLSSNEKHNLKTKFLKQWLEIIQNENENVTIDTTKISFVSALTEWTIENDRRIDILVLAKNNEYKLDTIIGIENKLDHIESPKQVSDYQDYISKEFPNQNTLMLFLTPDGRYSVTSKDNSPCTIINISYKTIISTCEILMASENDKFVKLFIESVIRHINKLIKEYTLDSKLKNRIRKMLMNQENRDVIRAIISNLPSVTYVFNGLENNFGKEEKFKCHTHKTKEFQLYLKGLNATTHDIGKFAFILECTANPFIDDTITLRLMVSNSNNYSKEKIKHIQNKLGLANDNSKRKNWWIWKSLWVGDTYKFQDLHDEDIINLTKLINNAIETKYKELEIKVQKYKTSENEV